MNIFRIYILYFLIKRFIGFIYEIFKKIIKYLKEF